MDNNIIGAEAAKLAGLQMDFLQKYRSGNILLEHFEWFLGLNVDERVRLSGGVCLKNKPDLFSQKIVSAQERFYKEEFGKKCDFAGLLIPDAENIYVWLMCMTEKVGIEELLSGGKNPQPFWKYKDIALDELVDLTFGRDGHKEPYVFRAKPNLGADENMRNISANKIAEMGINTIGLKERLAIGRFLSWFKEKKIILDQKVVTLCTGSRYSDGNVPNVRWRGVKVSVDWFHPDFAYGGLRSRQVVS